MIVNQALAQNFKQYSLLPFKDILPQISKILESQVLINEYIIPKFGTANINAEQRDQVEGYIWFKLAIEVEKDFVLNISKDKKDILFQRFLTFLTISGNKNFAEANFRLGNVYLLGEVGVVIDLNLALEYYRKIDHPDEYIDPKLTNLGRERIRMIGMIRNGALKHPVNPTITR